MMANDQRGIKDLSIQKTDICSQVEQWHVVPGRD